MPRVMKKKFRPGEIAVAWRSFTFGEGGIIHRRTRLHGDHAAVRDKPQHFVLDGTPLPNELQDLPAPAQAPPEFHQPAPPIPDDDCAVAIQSFSVGLGKGFRTQAVQKGQRLRLTDPLVQAHPDLFRTPAKRLPVGG